MQPRRRPEPPSAYRLAVLVLLGAIAAAPVALPFSAVLADEGADRICQSR